MNSHAGHGEADGLLEAAARLGVRTHVLADGEEPADVARAADTSVLGAAGGDGTIAAVAAAAVERSLPLVVVPFGTRNHFARDLGVDDPLEAVHAFGGGGERQVDVGYANERLFLNNVSLGLYARLVHRREHHRRRRDALARLRAFAAVAGHRRDDRITVDGEAAHARIVLVSNNAYELSVLSLGERERLDEGRLHVYAPQGLLARGWEERSGASFTVDASVRSLRAAVDGEPYVLETPIAFRIVPRALRVLVPEQPKGGG